MRLCESLAPSSRPSVPGPHLWLWQSRSRTQRSQTGPLSQTGPSRGQAEGLWSGVCLRPLQLWNWAGEAGQTANLAAHRPGPNA